ncbi:hypothetical protein Tco_0698666 [Tanacetum coccineum]
MSNYVVHTRFVCIQDIMDFCLEEIKMIKSSIDDPPELELKDLPYHLEYAFLEGTDKLPVIISKELKDEEKATLLKDDFKPAVQHQRRVNPKIHEVIKKEVIKLLDAGLIYPISDSPWVSLVHCVSKKGGMTVVENEDNELIPTRLVMGWHICIDYRRLNDATRKDQFPLPFIDQMLERLSRNEYYCFLDGFSGYFQIPIDPQDQEKTTFTCTYGTFAYRRMPFGLCNAPGTFQRSSDFDSCESNTSVETLDCMPEPVVNEPKVVCTPKVWSDAPIIEEYKSDRLELFMQAKIRDTIRGLEGTRVNTARPKAEVNTVKASASWVWKPKHEDLDHVSKSNSASKTLARYDYVDALGRFKSVLAWDFKKH